MSKHIKAESRTQYVRTWDAHINALFVMALDAGATPTEYARFVDAIATVRAMVEKAADAAYLHTLNKR